MLDEGCIFFESDKSLIEACHFDLSLELVVEIVGFIVLRR